LNYCGGKRLAIRYGVLGGLLPVDCGRGVRHCFRPHTVILWTAGLRHEFPGGITFSIPEVRLRPTPKSFTTEWAANWGSDWRTEYTAADEAKQF
jgi:hypothetical protein